MLKKKICKVILAGDGGVGKTTLISTKKNQRFSEATQITIGVDFACFPTTISACSNEELTFLVFDLGGQKRFHFMHTSYIVGAKAAIILYDLSRPKTFDNIPYWHSVLQKENPFMPILIGGTKKDLVQPTDLQVFIRDWKSMLENLPNNKYILDHLFLSSKAYFGIEETFQLIGEMILTQPEIILKQQQYAQSHAR